MIFLIIIVIQILIAGCFRFVAYKNETIRNYKYRIYLQFSTYFFMMSILAYYATDTYEGLIRVSLSLSFFGVLFYFNNQKYTTEIINIMTVVLMPIYFIFISDSTYYILTSLSTLLLPVIIIFNVLFLELSDFNSPNWRRTVFVIIGLIVSLTFLPLVNESSNLEDLGKEFAEEELDFQVKYIFPHKGFRGEEIDIFAFNELDERVAKMIYKDNSIISYEID